MRVTDEFFKTFPECSLPRTVSRNTIKIIGHHSRLRDVMDQSYLIYACTRANHARYSSVHVTLCGGLKHIVYKSNIRERTWQVETVEQTEQCHIKFVETSHYLKRRGRKAFVESLFLRS